MKNLCNKHEQNWILKKKRWRIELNSSWWINESYQINKYLYSSFRFNSFVFHSLWFIRWNHYLLSLSSSCSAISTHTDPRKECIRLYTVVSVNFFLFELQFGMFFSVWLRKSERKKSVVYREKHIQKISSVKWFQSIVSNAFTISTFFSLLFCFVFFFVSSF